MSEYVPSVGEAREVCVRGEGRLMSHAEFDRMIANVQAEVLEGAAKDYAYVFAVTAYKSPVYKWLRNRAATIAERTQR